MTFSILEMCLSIAIVAIVKRNVTTDTTEDEAKNTCPVPDDAPEDSVVQTVPAWNTVFVISAVFNLIFGTIYVIFGTDKVQPWNDSEPKKVR
ncbi:hypothetical protein O3P69_001596 [Scylla paramamosain]|uniref:Uncharacterized protein n=1 Tax=Scylla paramamosain TaxID=85552 RepID=A0AAW0UZU8_SCYPA